MLMLQCAFGPMMISISSRSFRSTAGGVVNALQSASFFLRSKVPGRVRIGLASGAAAQPAPSAANPAAAVAQRQASGGAGAAAALYESRVLPGQASARDAGDGKSTPAATSSGAAGPSGAAAGAGGGASGAGGTGGNAPPGVPSVPSVPSARQGKFERLLSAPVIDIPPLRALAWNGIPPDQRAACWRILMGYVPPNSERQSTLRRKRREYRDLVWQHFEREGVAEDRGEEELAVLRQIAVDVPRTAPGVAFVREACVQRALERVLFIRATRAAASSYVQGMNDLVIPFLVVFFGEAAGATDTEAIGEAVSAGLDRERMADAEADCYWCLGKLLDKIQTHYTFAQPGIQEKIFQLGALVRRVDADLADHLQREGVDYVQFAFRWVNCLLQREVPLALSLRLWDTYLAEGETFADFLAYVLAAFLLNWSDKLKKLEFQEMVMFLQNLPTSQWKGSELEMVLAKAHQYRITFEHAPSHLQ